MRSKFVLPLITLLFICCSAYSQSVNEEEIFTLPEGTAVDAWSLVYSPDGKPAYVYYDAVANKYSIWYDGKESRPYEFISSYDIKFDSKGNYYILTSEIVDQDSYLYNYTLVVNGDSVASFLNAEPYNSLMTKNDEYKFTMKTSQEPDATTKIVTYSIANGVSESPEYAFVKLIYKGNYYPEDYEGEGQTSNYFVDKDGNSGFIVSDGITASIMLGDNITKTEYTDIDQSSFVYDNNGELTYIAKIGGTFYTSPGNEFVVQGSKRYQSFDNVYFPILFTSKNEPVYAGMESISEYTYRNFLVIGDERQPIYLDKEKSEKSQGFTGGLYDISIAPNGDISYYGSMFEEVSGKEGSFSNVTYVTNNITGKFYYGLGQWKFNSTGEGIASYNPDKDYYSMAMLQKKGDKAKMIKGSKFSSILDYGYTNAGKIYYTSMKEGNYDKKIKPEYYVYIDNILIGKYESILFEGFGDNYRSIQFDGQGNYAYAVSTFDYYEEGQDYVNPAAYVITNKGKQDPKIKTGNALKDFNYIDFMFFTSNNRLFYFGGINDNPNNKYYSEMIIDGKNMDKVYSGVANFNYDKLTNTATFTGSRENKLYKVTVSF